MIWRGGLKIVLIEEVMKQMRRLPRPRSMHDTTIAAESAAAEKSLEKAALDKLPATPTRRDAGYFTGPIDVEKSDQQLLSAISESAESSSTVESRK